MAIWVPQNGQRGLETPLRSGIVKYFEIAIEKWPSGAKGGKRGKAEPSGVKPKWG